MNKISTHFILFSLTIVIGSLNLVILLKLIRLYKEPAQIILACDTNTLIKAGESFRDGLLRQKDYVSDNKKEPNKRANKANGSQKKAYKKSNNQSKKSVENQKIGESGKIQ